MPATSRALLFAAALGAGSAISFAPLLAGGLALAAPEVQPVAAERRAVRGAPLDDPAESPELRELRRFERAAFPQPGDVPAPAAEAGEDEALPAGLRGRWAGTGDVPEALRSPPAQRGPGRGPPMPDSDWLRSLRLPDLPMRWDPQVLRFVEYFSKDARGRSIMGSFLRRMGRYEAVITRALERRKLPRDLIFLAMIESGFEPKATSNKAAGGIWQFMPGVAKAYGLEVSYWVDARRDPERAVEAAAHYFEDLYARFGSWPLAFAAYHAGYGAILQSIGRYNTNDYWELCKHEAGLPWETTLYVPKILAVALIGRNREAFGFGDVVSDPPLAYERVQAKPGLTLAAAARAAGTTVEVLQSLNPELIRDRTPPDRGAVSLRVPVGSAQVYARAIEGAGADQVDTYVLRFGESLDDVAKRYGLSARDLRRLNGLRDAADLKGGVTIVVPARALAAGERPTQPEAGDAEEDKLLVSVPEQAFSYPDRERVFYKAREGDTLEELASVFQVSEDQIAEWNSLDPTAKLHPRMVLQVFVRKEFDRASVVLLDPEKLRVVTLGSEEFHALETARRGKTRLHYNARAGDTLAKIARRYGLAPGDLARVNRLSWNSELSEGQRIVVYSPTPDLPREVTVGRSVPHKRPAALAGPAPGAATRAGTKPGQPARAAVPAPRSPAGSAPAPKPPAGATSAKSAPGPSASGKSPGGPVRPAPGPAATPKAAAPANKTAPAGPKISTPAKPGATRLPPKPPASAANGAAAKPKAAAGPGVPRAGHAGRPPRRP